MFNFLNIDCNFNVFSFINEELYNFNWDFSNKDFIFDKINNLSLDLEGNYVYDTYKYLF